VEGARAIAATAAALFGSRPVAVVAAIARDKDHAAIQRSLARNAARLTLTEFDGERATPARDLLAAAAAPRVEAEVVADPADALARARRWAGERGGAVLVTGSFFLVGEAIPLLRREVPRAI
jgi:folylpolyglutamate synthase/dihydropteroate synthase